jgi:hypothetical protein
MGSKLRIENSEVFSHQEMILLCIYGQMLQSSDKKEVRDLYSACKGKYRTVDALIQACYPFQNEEGRPTKKVKNKVTGLIEWQPYKRITDSAAQNILVESLFNKPNPETHLVIVEIHPDGEPVGTESTHIDMKTDNLLSLEECLNLIEDAKGTLEMVKDDEEMAYDNLPEGIQMSERGDTMQEGIDALDDIIYSLDDSLSYLYDASNSEAREAFVTRNPWDNVTDGVSVNHKKFGTGIVLCVDDGFITIHFQTKDARFNFPAAFENGFLTINK